MTQNMTDVVHVLTISDCMSWMIGDFISICTTPQSLLKVSEEDVRKAYQRAMDSMARLNRTASRC